MIERTVVGWDGSSGADRALDWALARPSTEKLVVVHVDNDVALQETFAANSPAAAARITLMEKADALRSANPDRTIHTELVQGEIATALAAFSSPSTVVAVGTRHSTERRTRRSWSVGARVAGAAEGPVAVIPRAPHSEGRSIVVGVDDPEEAALLFAAEEAMRTGQTLRPVRAWQAGHHEVTETAPDAAYVESLATMYRNLVSDALDSILDRYPDLIIEPVIRQGDAAAVLLDVAKGATMLVVGNRGFRGVKRFFLGSVSQAVVLSADIPTVVVSGGATT